MKINTKELLKLIFLAPIVFLSGIIAFYLIILVVVAFITYAVINHDHVLEKLNCGTLFKDLMLPMISGCRGKVASYVNNFNLSKYGNS